MIQARVAGVSLHLHGGDPDFFPRRFREYEAQIEKPDISMKMSRVPEITLASGQEIVHRNGLLLIRSDDGYLHRYVKGSKSGKLLHEYCTSPDYTQCEYTLLESRNHPTLSLTDFEYVYSGEAFSNRLASLGGLVMHGSAIAFDGKGIVFSAPSGTGKSTHAGLWKQYYGERVVHINDDKPALRFDGGTPEIYGTPWSGKTDINRNISAPLHAIVFLQQAPENRLTPLSVPDAMMHIHRETVRPFYDEALSMKVLETTEKLISSVPVFLLECTISRDAVELVKTAML